MDIKTKLRGMAGKKYQSDWATWVQKQCTEAADHIESLEARIAELTQGEPVAGFNFVVSDAMPKDQMIIRSGKQTVIVKNIGETAAPIADKEQAK